MERVKVLIDKLIQQQQRNEGVDALLLTTQLLQNELLLLQKKNAAPVTKKVTVVMPSNASPVVRREPKPVSAPAPEENAEVFVPASSLPAEKETPAAVQEPIQVPVQEPVQIPVQEPVEIPVQEPVHIPEQKVEEPIVAPVASIYRIEETKTEPVPEVVPSSPIYRVPPVPQMSPISQVPPTVEPPKTEVIKEEHEPVIEQPVSEVAPVVNPVSEVAPVINVAERHEHEAYLPPKQKSEEKVPEPEKIVHPLVMDNHFDAMEETPTLAQYQPTKKDQKLQKEINDFIGESKETLNDRLKEHKKELAHVLKETPIKDLRKAIGVNDRFVFVNELFRGDETMYERSIKTINGFHILPEAEYWINRELKVKLGWDDYKDSVQHFYHLVRRRFS